MNVRSAPWTESDGSSGVAVVLESAPGASRMVRHQVNALADILPALMLQDLRVVLTELVGNAVRHGSGQPIEVVIEVSPNGLTRGVVGDHGRGRVEISEPREPGDTSGLGLRIVDTLASRWGVRTPSSDVWFELDPVV